MNPSANQSIIEEAGLPDNFVALDSAPIIPGQVSGAPPMPNAMSNYYSTSFSPALQHDTTFVGTQYGGPNVPKTSVMPLGNAGNPITNAASASTTTKIVTEVVEEMGSTAVSLETNGVLNTTQNVLNLVNGTGGISPVSSPGGVVAINGAVFGASGVTHSEGVVPDPGASAGTTRYLREDATFDVPPGTSAISLETNSVANSDQAVLNLLNGTGGISIVAGALGAVTVNESVFVASGAGHAAGAVPDPGGTAGSSRFLCENATFAVPAGTAGPSILVYALQSLATNVSVSAATLTTVDSVSVTMPSSGGPFRVQIEYDVAFTTTAAATSADFYITDGTNNFGRLSIGAGTSPVPFNGGGRACFSGTYTASTAVTFTLKCEANQNITILAAMTNAVGGPNSSIEAAVLTSN